MHASIFNVHVIDPTFLYILTGIAAPVTKVSAILAKIGVDNESLDCEVMGRYETMCKCFSPRTWSLQATLCELYIVFFIILFNVKRCLSS